MRRFIQSILLSVLVGFVFCVSCIDVKAQDENPYPGTVWITDFIQLEDDGPKYYIGDTIDIGGSVTITKETIYIEFDPVELKYTVHSDAGLADGEIGEYTYENGEFHDVGLLWYDGVGLRLDVMGVWRLKKETSSSDPAPAPTTHEVHAANADLVPEKNTDGNYQIGFDGMPVMVCSVCGETHTDMPVAHKLWEEEIVKAIGEHNNFDAYWRKKNEAGENPVTVASDTFISFDKATLEKLGELGESVILKFKYNGVYYVTTIPAGSDFASLADENGWAGFAYIMSVFGGREITAEEFELN